MRDAYHQDLDAITDSLVELSRIVGGAVGRATQALLDADLQLAETVISGDADVDSLYREIEQRCFDLIARQQPVATDLRVLITSLRMVSDLERAGDYATHIAELARRRFPASAVPPELRSTILEMGQVAQRIVAKVGTVVAAKDLDRALEIERDDDVMDELHRQLFRVLLDPNWEGGVETAVDVALCGRYYERLADHAVSVARRVIYLITGETPAPAET